MSDMINDMEDEDEGGAQFGHGLSGRFSVISSWSDIGNDDVALQLVMATLNIVLEAEESVKADAFTSSDAPNQTGSPVLAIVAVNQLVEILTELIDDIPAIRNARSGRPKTPAAAAAAAATAATAATASTAATAAATTAAIAATAAKAATAATQQQQSVDGEGDQPTTSLSQVSAGRS